MTNIQFYIVCLCLFLLFLLFSLFIQFNIYSSRFVFLLFFISSSYLYLLLFSTQTSYFRHKIFTTLKTPKCFNCLALSNSLLSHNHVWLIIISIVFIIKPLCLFWSVSPWWSLVSFNLTFLNHPFCLNPHEYFFPKFLQILLRIFCAFSFLFYSFAIFARIFISEIQNFNLSFFSFPGMKICCFHSGKFFLVPFPLFHFLAFFVLTSQTSRNTCRVQQNLPSCLKSTRLRTHTNTFS